MHVGKFFAVAALSSMVTVAMVTSAPASAAPRCNDIEIVFARGTDEPAGIGRVGQALVDELRPLVGKKTIGTYAVNYPASYDFLAGGRRRNGCEQAHSRHRRQVPEDETVLGGYSQGAAVMDVVATSPVAGLGYAAPLPAAIVPRIAAITVFGNPSARLGQPLTRMSPDFGARTADLCNTNDPICSTGQDFNSHVHYPESGLVKVAAKWVSSHVQQRD